jgi:hypothetical protein
MLKAEAGEASQPRRAKPHPHRFDQPGLFVIVRFRADA